MSLAKSFLGILFRCCHVYGRIYPNAHGTAYQGSCPRCMARVRVPIGPHGTRQRSFSAQLV